LFKALLYLLGDLDFLFVTHQLKEEMLKGRDVEEGPGSPKTFVLGSVDQLLENRQSGMWVKDSRRSGSMLARESQRCVDTTRIMNLVLLFEAQPPRLTEELARKRTAKDYKNNTRTNCARISQNTKANTQQETPVTERTKPAETLNNFLHPNLRYH